MEQGHWDEANAEKVIFSSFSRLFIIFTWRDVKLSAYKGCKGFQLGSLDLARNLQIQIHGFIQGLYSVILYFKSALQCHFQLIWKFKEDFSVSGCEHYNKDNIWCPEWSLLDKLVPFISLWRNKESFDCREYFHVTLLLIAESVFRIRVRFISASRILISWSDSEWDQDPYQNLKMMYKTEQNQMRIP